MADLTALRGSLSDEDPTVRDYAVRVLGGQRGTEAIALWRKTLRDPDPAMRLLILERLAQHDEGRALLPEALADEDETVRARTTFWLGQGTPQHTRESDHGGRP